ncbi:MAG TPA: DUF4142 domain-containing protein, partial [Chitinophagaceae bacterium]|nr:DUF4142 domain-containing protein [Chitinophagaceae bacterium]
MKKYLCSAALLLVIGCEKFHNDDDEITSREFVLQASMTNFTQVNIASLASTRSMNDGMIEFAQTVINYHTAAQSQLKSLATELSLFAPDSIDAEHEKIKDQLLDLSGRKFDSVYIHNVVMDYERAINFFLQETVTGENE